MAAQTLLASAVQQRLVTPASLAEALDARPRITRRSLIAETIRDVSGGSLSEYELMLPRLCRAHRLPEPTRQRRRQDASGRWRYLDAEFDEYRLVVELDGQHHMEALAWWEDMMRDNDLVARDGRWVMRFAGFALRRESERVASVLRAFFERHPPSAG
jgi:very-short-patch-repair endonuclease